jgi:hypothetical protein
MSTDNPGKTNVEMPTPKLAKREDVQSFTIASLEMESLFKDLENINLRRDASQKKKQIAELTAQLEAHQFDRMQYEVNEKIKIINPRYNAISKKIAESVGISDPKKMSIDTETFIVKEIGVDIPG